ncbi:hypothetical protein PTNB73_01888 [Pyrenophora teres f. teres]|nr:hypothetical protein PTNB85_01888 [Pyrenophora teres f. teres]KAE8853792.1 hypothetical protein HRS9122_00784 [Pyrenophora teres f. teres]KAE8872737.1 hypothetical protein PTNB73_01888 [Pyrenophora teres f. teres]
MTTPGQIKMQGTRSYKCFPTVDSSLAKSPSIPVQIIDISELRDLYAVAKGHPINYHDDSLGFALSPIADGKHDTEEQHAQWDLIQSNVATCYDICCNYINKPVHLVARIQPKSHLASSELQPASPLPEYETRDSEKQASGNITSTVCSTDPRLASENDSKRWSNFSGDHTYLHKDLSYDSPNTRETTPTAGPSSSPTAAEQGQRRFEGPSPSESAAALIVPPHRPNNQFDRYAVPVDKPPSKWLYTLPHRYPMPVEKCQDQTVPTVDLPIENILPVPEKHWHSSVHSCRTRKSHLYWTKRAIEPPTLEPRARVGCEVPALRKAPRAPKGSMERFIRQFRKYWIWKAYPWTQHRVSTSEGEESQSNGTQPQPNGTEEPPVDDPDDAPPPPPDAPNFSKKFRKQNPQHKPSGYLEPPPRITYKPLVLNGFERWEPDLEIVGFLHTIFERTQEEDSNVSEYDPVNTLGIHGIIPKIIVEDWNDVSNPRPLLADTTGSARVILQQEDLNRSHLDLSAPAAARKQRRGYKHLWQRQKNVEASLPLKRDDSVTSPASALRGGHDVPEDEDEAEYEAGDEDEDEEDRENKRVIYQARKDAQAMQDAQERNRLVAIAVTATTVPAEAPVGAEGWWNRWRWRLRTNVRSHPYQSLPSGTTSASASAPPSAPAVVVVERKKDKLKRKFKEGCRRIMFLRSGTLQDLHRHQ